MTKTKLNPKNLGLAGGIIWGLGMFLTTLISIKTGYAEVFLKTLSNIYPWYKINLLGSFIALIFGFIDMFVFLWLLAMLYNWLSR